MTPEQEREKRKRQILIQTLIKLVHLMPFEGWTHDDAFVCWAIRLAAFEGREADMVWVMARTGLSRGTVQRRLKANVLAGTVIVNEVGKRKVYVHTAKADAMTADYYAALDAILSRYGEEAADEIERLRKEIAANHTYIHELRTGFPWSDLDEAEAEIERLRKAMDDMETEQHESNNLQWREIERLRAELAKAQNLADIALERVVEPKARKP